MSQILFCLKEKIGEGAIACKIYDYLSGNKRTWLKIYRKCITQGHSMRPQYKICPKFTNSAKRYRIRKLTEGEIYYYGCNKGIRTFILHGMNILSVQHKHYVGGVRGLSYRGDRISYRLWKIST